MTNKLELQLNELSKEEQDLIKKYRSMGAALSSNDLDGLNAFNKLFLSGINKITDEKEKNDAKNKLEDDLNKLLWLSANKKYSEEVVDWLFKQGANTNYSQVPPINKNATREEVRSSFLSPIDAVFEAIRNNNESFIKVWLNNSGNPSHKNTDGETVLRWVLEREMYELASLLLEKGADINEKISLSQNNLLHYAASDGNPIMIAWLLENGANPSFKSINGLPEELVPVYSDEVLEKDRRFAAQQKDSKNYIDPEVMAEAMFDILGDTKLHLLDPNKNQAPDFEKFKLMAIKNAIFRDLPLPKDWDKLVENKNTFNFNF